MLLIKIVGLIVYPRYYTGTAQKFLFGRFLRCQLHVAFRCRVRHVDNVATFLRRKQCCLIDGTGGNAVVGGGSMRNASPANEEVILLGVFTCAVGNTDEGF